VLPTRTQLVQEELLGELFLQSKRRKNKRDLRTLVSLELTNKKLKENSIDIAMKSLISSTANSLLKQAMLKL